jgi:hypothetical protein
MLLQWLKDKEASKLARIEKVERTQARAAIANDTVYQKKLIVAKWNKLYQKRRTAKSIKNIKLKARKRASIASLKREQGIVFSEKGKIKPWKPTTLQLKLKKPLTLNSKPVHQCTGLVNIIVETIINNITKKPIPTTELPNEPVQPVPVVKTKTAKQLHKARKNKINKKRAKSKKKQIAKKAATAAKRKLTMEKKRIEKAKAEAARVDFQQYV